VTFVVAQLVKTFPASVESESSLRVLESTLAVGPCPEQLESCPHRLPVCPQFFLVTNFVYNSYSSLFYLPCHHILSFLFALPSYPFFFICPAIISSLFYLPCHHILSFLFALPSYPHFSICPAIISFFFYLPCHHILPDLITPTQSSVCHFLVLLLPHVPLCTLF
jgi:hypothetical protein